MKRIIAYLIVSATLGLIGIMALAEVNLNTFRAGDIIRSDEVNENFRNLAVASDGKQEKITGQCPAGSSIRIINEDGSVECENDDVGAGEGGDIIPTGAIMPFNLTSCPTGWAEFALGRGRTIVGTPSGGALSVAVGDALKDQEERAHSHDVNPPKTSTTSAGEHNHIWAKYSGASKTWTSGDNKEIGDWDDGMDSDGKGNYPMHRNDDTGSGTFRTNEAGAHLHSVDIGVVESTEVASTLPYVQLLMCEKN